MSNNLELVSSEIKHCFNALLGSEIYSITALRGDIYINEPHINIRLLVGAVFEFRQKDAVLRLQLSIQGDEIIVEKSPHIGLYFELFKQAIFNASNYCFHVSLPRGNFIKEISCWSFRSKYSERAEIINTIVFSFQNGENMFIDLGSTCDATIQIKKQSIERFFEEKNHLYDNEFELKELFSTNGNVSK